MKSMRSNYFILRNSTRDRTSSTLYPPRLASLHPYLAPPRPASRRLAPPRPALRRLAPPRPALPRWTWLDLAGLGWPWLDLAGLSWAWLDSAGLGWPWLVDLAGLSWAWLDSAGLQTDRQTSLHRHQLADSKKLTGVDCKKSQKTAQKIQRKKTDPG